MSQVSIIDIEGNHPQIPTEFIADDGSAVPIANQLEILGATVPAGILPVYTTGSGNTITTNVQISQAIAASDALNVGLAAFDSADFAVDANGFVSLAGGSTQSVDSINVDASTAPGTDPVLPTVGGVITVTGAQIAAGLTGNVIRTNSLVANTYTIEIQRASAQAVSTIGSNGVAHFDSADFSVDANGFVALAGGVPIESLGVQATSGTGTDPVLPTVAGVIELEGALIAAGSNPLRAVSTAANTVQYQVQTSQALAAADSTKVGLSNFDSAAFDVSATGFVQLNGGGIAATSFDVQANTGPGTDPVVPTAAGVVTVNGTAVANHSVVLESRSRAANAYNLEIQYATSAAATDATKSGVAHFNSTQFSVDANGFVALAGGGQAIDQVNVDANTGPGTDPVLPSATGEITVTGAQVANGTVGTNVIRTNSLAANTYTIEVQRSTSNATTDVSKNGVAHFRTSDFTVDANAFVILSTTGAGKTITGDTGGALSPTANNWNILGGPGVTTSGSGSTLTINSVVFTDTTAATLAVDNGYFATAAGTYPMPATAVQGELVQVVCDTTGAVVLDCPANNFIRIGSLITSSGGTVTSTLQGDSLTLRYRLSALTWEATSVIGTWLVA